MSRLANTTVRLRAAARRASRSVYGWVALAGLLLGLGLAVFTALWPPLPPLEGPPVALWRSDLGQVEAIPLELYVAGVVAAEMPVTFHPEALKAQAVAARTLAVRSLVQPRATDGTALTDQASRDQAWSSQEALRRRWGWWRYPFAWRKIAEAVLATEGEILTYQGEPIFAAYHSTSGGQTEASENVWREALPYLVSLYDPYGARGPYAQTERFIDRAQLAGRLGPLEWRGEEPPLFVLSRYPSGRVERVQYGSRIYTGRQIREALGLPSTWFEVIWEGTAPDSCCGATGTAWACPSTGRTGWPGPAGPIGRSWPTTIRERCSPPGRATEGAGDGGPLTGRGTGRMMDKSMEDGRGVPPSGAENRESGGNPERPRHCDRGAPLDRPPGWSWGR